MLVLGDPQPGAFFMLGARVAASYDSAIPKEGVEVYRINQHQDACQHPSREPCSNTDRRTQPFPPAESGTEHVDRTQHVHSVGDRFEVGDATIEVLQRVGNNYRIRVADHSDAEPRYGGRFSDDDDNPHQLSIEAIGTYGITQGCNPPDNTHYCPSDTVARAHMMAFLARALRLETDQDTTSSRFRDVPDDAWYLPYLEGLADMGVVAPYEDGTFRPDEPLTRADMAVLLTRAFPYITPASDPAGVFTDVPPDTPHAAEIEAIHTAGITQGCSTNPLKYCPNDPVPRDQMATFLARTLTNRP